MRINRSDLMIASTILIIFAVVIGFLVYGGDDLLGLSASDVSDLVTLLPGIFVLLVAFYAVSISRGYMLSGAVAGVGLAFAFLIHQMNEVSLLMPDLEMTVTDVQLVIIVVFLIIAAAMAVRNE